MKRRIKILFSSNRNPHFETFTDYIEKAFKEEGCDVIFFENRNFLIPGRVRDKLVALHLFDLKFLNQRLLKIAADFKPDLFLENGGWNILPETIQVMKRNGIKTALWTNDPPKSQVYDFDPIRQVAPHYDFVFIAGTDCYGGFAGQQINKITLMPFACDPDFQKPVELTSEEKRKYGFDVCFVGSGINVYSQRIRFLESLADINLGVWGPGWETLPSDSPLKRNGCIKGGALRPVEWVKLFSAAKIVFHAHYRDPLESFPHYQANPRVFEALACGAFLLLDEQRDVVTMFKDGEHLVIYKDIDELRVKTLFYLQNDAERKRIAESGLREVLAKHTYRHRIKDILNVVGLGSDVK